MLSRSPKIPITLLCLLVFTISLGLNSCITSKDGKEHVKVYHETGMFGGWPANHGIWIWDNEILVGFSKGFYKDLGNRHNIDREKTELHLLARSLDGGRSWNIEDPGANDGDLVVPNNGSYHGTIRTDVQPPELKELESAINFEHPDFALTARLENVDGGQSRYWYSYNRGKDWTGPYAIPNFNTNGIAARTDYLIDGENQCLLFLTAAKSNGEEGRPLCIQTKDGGLNWSFISWIGPEPKGFSIMPASVRISETDILITTRRREGENRFIAAYLSEDNGRTWTQLDNPVDDTGVGNPPALIKLQDGRICLAYGYRAEPFSIRAKISGDNGKTWSKDYILRGGGSGRDLGYPRMVQRPDGKIVVLYYFEDKADGPERFIEATIWDPPNP